MMESLTPRLKSHIRVSAHIRRAEAAGAFASIIRRGDADAGAIAVKVWLGAGRARLFLETRDGAGAHVWREAFDGPVEEAQIDAKLARETAFDSDIWIVEIEDRDGRAFLDDAG